MDRFSEASSSDREIQRTLMELLNQMDGFDSLGQVSQLIFWTLFHKVFRLPQNINHEQDN